MPVPIQGGTDVMVELNFDRARPAVLLNLNEVAELRGWSREDGKIWLGAGLTYAEAMEPRLAEALPALAEASRTVGGPTDPKPRDDRRESRHLVACRRRIAAAARVRRRGEARRACAASALCHSRSSWSGRSRTCWRRTS